MRRVVAAVAVVLCGCSGGSGPDYAAYRLLYDNLPFMQDGRVYSESEFDDFADRYCGNADAAGAFMSEGYDGTVPYFMVRAACGEDAAAAGLAVSSLPEDQKRFLPADWADALDRAERLRDES